MARFAEGDIILFPMPFSDGSGAKRRPSLVLAELSYYGGMDYLALELFASDIISGTLDLKSYIRPLYLFAPAEYTIVRKIRTLAPSKLKQVKEIIASVVHP